MINGNCSRSMVTMLLIIAFSTDSTLLPTVACGREFPPPVTEADVPRLKRLTSHVRELSEDALTELVPVQSGLRYIGCPDCTGGRQENQLEWSPAKPEHVTCRYCGHDYPSSMYPQDQTVTVLNPRGQSAAYPYWADKNGYRHFFAARRDDAIREYLADRTRDLALLYAATGDLQYARRAALLLDRFAQVFPGWCYHFDYPFQQKQIYSGDVSSDRFRPGYRTARWTWWAYSDIPLNLVQAYDWIRDSGAFRQLSEEIGVDSASRIEDDLIRNAAEQVLANPEPYTNMSPTAWRSLVYTGRVIREPRYVHETVRRLTTFMETQFLYDGFWPEGSPDYAAQTIGGLEQVLTLLHGYTDPPEYRDAADGRRFDQLHPAADFPVLQQARAALMMMRFPNGRMVPVHDSWPTSRRGSLELTRPWLLPALGHVCAGGGAGDRQSQFHLTWSGGYGHSHADNLSLLLFAHGRELLSDLGYTHTAYRSWTIATAAHNTVVIDGLNQSLGSRTAPSDGRLLICDLKDPRVQVIRADGTRGYSGTAAVYQRTLIVIEAGNDRRYAVDLFEVEGGTTHDYFLHGDADRAGMVAVELDMSPLPTLLPPGFQWTPTRNEGEAGRISEPHYAYGFLRQLQSARVSGPNALTVTFGTGIARPQLRIHLLPQAEGQLIIGQNPSIRQAAENDALLEQFQRPFLLLRHTPADGRSLFVSVLEPVQESPFLTSVRCIPTSDKSIVLQIEVDGRTDYVAIADGARLSFSAGRSQAEFAGILGVFTVRKATADYAYSLGTGGWTHGDVQVNSSGPFQASLQHVDGNVLALRHQEQTDAARLPTAGEIIRLITEDEWIYPFTVAAVEPASDGCRVQVVEGPGLVFDPQERRLQLTAFPQRSHVGTVRAEWISGVHTDFDSQE